MIQVLTCPQCNHTSELPQKISVQAVLKCRNCGSLLVLGEVLNTVSDAWEIVDDPNATLCDLPVLNDPAEHEAPEPSGSSGLATAADWDQASSETSDSHATNPWAETTSEVAFSTHVEDSEQESFSDQEFDDSEDDSEVPDIEATIEEWNKVDDGLQIVSESGVTDKELTSAATESEEFVSAETELAESIQHATAPVPMPALPAKKKVDWSKFDNGGQASARSKNKTRSPIWSILSIASGGFAAVPIATLLIWHVLGKDPLDMGPTVARYVPWIVPTRFHPYQSSYQPPARFARPEDRAPPASGTSGFRKFDDVLPPAEFAADNLSASDVVNAFSTAGAGSAKAVHDETPLTTMPAPSPSTDSTVPAEDLAATENSPNVFSQIKLIEGGLDAWEQAKQQSGTKSQVAQKLYSDLSALALMIDEVPRGNPVQRVIADKLKKSARAIAEQADVQGLIQAGSRFWIKKLGQESKLGLAVFGKVVAADAASGEWIVTLEPEVNSSSLLRIVVPGLLAPAIEVGQNLLLLGAAQESAETLADEPAENSPAAAPRGITFVANYLYTL